MLLICSAAVIVFFIHLQVPQVFFAVITSPNIMRNHKNGTVLLPPVNKIVCIIAALLFSLLGHRNTPAYKTTCAFRSTKTSPVLVGRGLGYPPPPPPSPSSPYHPSPAPSLHAHLSSLSSPPPPSPPPPPPPPLPSLLYRCLQIPP